MSRWYHRRLRLHRWYAALAALWLFTWGSASVFAMGMANGSGHRPFVDRASEWIGMVVSLPFEEPLLGTLFALTFFLPLLVAPLGLTEPVYSE